MLNDTLIGENLYVAVEAHGHEGEAARVVRQRQDLSNLTIVQILNFSKLCKGYLFIFLS